MANQEELSELDVLMMRLAEQQPFVGMLVNLRLGVGVDELNDTLKEVVSACRRTGRAGSLTVKFGIKPEGDGQYYIADDIKASIPRGERKTLMFGTPDGKLVRRDPKQKDLFVGIRGVAEKPVNVRSINGVK